MGSKKYVIYKIKIVNNEDGSLEYRNETGYSTSSYEEMKRLYDKVKAEISSKNCKMALLGVDFRGNNKCILEDDFTKVDDEEQKIYETSFVEYANQIADLLKKMRMKRDYHYQTLDATSKKDSIIDHRIETFKEKKWPSKEEEVNEKLAIFAMAEEIKQERRLHKNELEILDQIKDKVDLKEMYEAFNSVSANEKRFRYLDDKLVKNLNIITEVYYSTERDRIKKVRKLEKKYGKIKNDAKNRKLICYNKCKINN